MALTRVPHLNLKVLRQLMQEMGNATAIYENRRHIRDILPEITGPTLQALAQMDEQLERAEEEYAFAEACHIRMLCLQDADYPARLRDCPDAPILLYYRGSADLNATHVLNIVGTRRISEYGKDVCQHFVSELSQLCPNALIMSGLAYGVDINAHRAALRNGMDTVGVLAHGLDQIYPRLHRDTAIEMLGHGGLLTEFMSRTNADKRNFVQRNRIVAGMSDATVVVESAAKGGGLITAEMAADYHREVFAFPGRVRDTYSKGCNQLIRNLRARIVIDAAGFVQDMGWNDETSLQRQLAQGIQQQMFPSLSEEEQRIVAALKGTDGKHINMLAEETRLPIPTLSALLFGMEMRGIIKMMKGSSYRLL